MAIKYTWEIEGLFHRDQKRKFKEEVTALAFNSRYQPRGGVVSTDGTLAVRRKSDAYSSEFAILINSSAKTVASLKLIAEKTEGSTPTTRTVFTFTDPAIAKIEYQGHVEPGDSEDIFFDYTKVTYKAESA